MLQPSIEGLVIITHLLVDHETVELALLNKQGTHSAESEYLLFSFVERDEKR